jgi:hypothetical protein
MCAAPRRESVVVWPIADSKKLEINWASLHVLVTDAKPADVKPARQGYAILERRRAAVASQFVSACARA